MNRLFSPGDDAVVRIHNQLAHLMKIKQELPNAAPGSVQALTREQISELIERAFWASLESNEGRPTRFCISIVAPEDFHDGVAFASPLRYDEAQIVKLAPYAPPNGCIVASATSRG